MRFVSRIIRGVDEVDAGAERLRCGVRRRKTRRSVPLNFQPYKARSEKRTWSSSTVPMQRRESVTILQNSRKTSSGLLDAVVEGKWTSMGFGKL